MQGTPAQQGSSLRVGIDRRTLSTPVGIRLAGALRDSHSAAEHQPLTTSAVYLREGSTAALLLACDLIALLPEDALELRSAVSAELDVPVSNILLSVSHSHATPSPLSWREYDYETSPELREQIEEFFARLRSTFITVARNARDQAAPARVGSAIGKSDINVNRRERRADGMMLLGYNPAGPVDQDVAVIRIDSESGAPLAMVFNYACHPDVLGPKSQYISPDFVGPARQAAEGVAGVTSVFLQGAAGDIYPCTGIVNEPDSVPTATQLGRRLGAEAGRVFETINLHRRPGHRAEWVSTASITTNWFYEDVPAAPGPQLAVESSTLDLPLRPLPSESEAIALVERQRAALEAVAPDASLSARLIANRRLIWAELQLRAIRECFATTLPVEIQVVRVGTAAIVALPGEVFTEIGIAIKEASPFMTTLISAYSNGVYFYIPTESAFELGGYEINSHQNYMRHSGPTPDWEREIVAEAARLLRQVHSSAPADDEVAVNSQ